MILMAFSRCNQPRKDKPAIVSMIDSTKTREFRTVTYDNNELQYYNWLSEMTLEKPIEVYRSILKKDLLGHSLNKKEFKERMRFLRRGHRSPTDEYVDGSCWNLEQVSTRPLWQGAASRARQPA